MGQVVVAGAGADSVETGNGHGDGESCDGEQGLTAAGHDDTRDHTASASASRALYSAT